MFVAYAGNVKPYKLQGNSKKLEVPYSRSKHEDILKLRQTIRVHPQTVYKMIFQTEPN